jgi:starch-binding outer membrane protein, SusD/RagB family
MRTKYRFSLFIAALFFISACEVTDLDPTHLLSGNNAFTDMDNVEQHLTGVYSAFRGGAYYGSTYGVQADMMGEDVYETLESLGNFRTVVDWTYVANDGIIAAAWVTPYAVISDANLVLVNLERFEESTAGQRARIRGQALAIRALAHFDLLRFFGQSYDRNSTALGIPIRLDNTIASPTRNTVQEVYDQVYADLAEAKALLSGTLDKAINSATARNLIDATVVDAIQARVALYAKDYPTAIASATNVIASSGLGLASRANFPTIWNNNAVANEVIWAVRYLPGQGQAGGNIYFSVNNRLSFQPSPEFVSLYDVTNDVRYSSYISTTLASPTGRVGQVVPIKYLGVSGATDGNVNFKVFRVAEMYLIRAEAQAFSNLDTQALADLNTLRASRINGYVNVSLAGDPLKQQIAIERRKELFIEGHRWFDIRRAGGSITRGAACGAPATACSLPSTSFRWIWPIPQGELDANLAMRPQQNQGYN